MLSIFSRKPSNLSPFVKNYLKETATRQIKSFSTVQDVIQYKIKSIDSLTYYTPPKNKPNCFIFAAAISLFYFFFYKPK
jgi:hypothetical protein